MLPKLKISIFLLKRLERVKQQSSGCLFGVFYGDGTLLLMGFNLESTIGQLNYEQIQYKFPAELDLCGIVKFGDCTDAEAHLNDILKDVDITDNPILLQSELGTLVGLRASIFMHGKLQEIPFEVMEQDELYRDFCFTRLRCSLSIYTEQNVEDLRRQMHAQRKLLSGGGIAFRIEPTKIFVTNTGLTNHVNNDCHIDDILRTVAENVVEQTTAPSNEHEQKKKRNNDEVPKLRSLFGCYGSDYDVVNIEVLRCRTRERPNGMDMGNSADATKMRNAAGGDAPTNGSDKRSSLNGAPAAVSICVQRNETKVCVPLEVEAMAMLYKHTKSHRLYDVLIESVCRALRLYEHSMLEHLQDNSNTTAGTTGAGVATVAATTATQTAAAAAAPTAQLLVPRGYHFLPPDLGHFLTCAYLCGLRDDGSHMQDKRKRLHRHFGLPVTRPYFRRTNCCRFRNEICDKAAGAADAPLMNTHIGVRPSGVVDGVQYLVQGNYQYYHYLQQQMQDKGWGCAYRSLQTLCSWFMLQGYTERVAVPTLREIQTYLVSIKDKPTSFVGSTQWIGSTEVSMCLQGFVEVDSKIRHVTSGGELGALGPELVQHFQVQGTPIMIGGGVLAHTIIGVDYCAQSGQIKFLILDPHYTGPEDLQTIQAKGWCGWKGVDFWDKKSYYNLCMPQRPIMF